MLTLKTHNKGAQLAAEKRGGTAKTLRLFGRPWRRRYVTRRRRGV